VRTSLIVAAGEDDVIGVAERLPWDIPEDLRRFKKLTLGHALVVGRCTYDSIVARSNRPLPGRFSVVVTSRPSTPTRSGMLFQADAATALEAARGIEAFAGNNEVFIIGGAQIYAQLLGEVDRVYLTRVHRRTAGDTVMPSGWLNPFSLIDEESEQGDQFSFLTYERA
jgi:dihydrofolate reductase